MRIALISRRFDPGGGGTERDLLITAGILAKAGHDVTLYAADVRGHAADIAVRHVPTPRFGRTLPLLWFANSAARIARVDGVDLVLSFARIIDADVLRSGGSAHSSYLRASRQWRSGLSALAMRLSPYHHAQMAIERHGFASPLLKKAVAVSNFVRNDLIRTFALNPEDIATIYNGVDLERFRPRVDSGTRDTLRRQFSIPRDSLVVAFVGNGFARKGLSFLIRAWPALASTPHLLVVGADRSISLYRRLAQRLGIGERVHFAGPRGQVEQIFAAVDAFALPSLFEPFGNVAMEAMASGLPVMVSAACGAAETLPVEMGKFVVADPTNVEEVGERLNALLADRKDLSAVARVTAEAFTWERYGKDLLALLATA